MPISTYPRRGHPISPHTLRDILDGPISAHGRPVNLPAKTRLCDLDASIWKSIGIYEAAIFGEAVVKRIAGSLPQLLEHFAGKWLPMPAIGATLDDLELELRTYNCLKYQWPECERDLQRLGYKSIGQAMKLRGFGIRNLVDLLSSLEALDAGNVQHMVAASSGKADGTLAKYLYLFANVTRTHTQHDDAPHKPVFLLTLLDVVENGSISRNYVKLDGYLTRTFRAYWSTYVPPGTWQENIQDPASRLVQNGFWKLVKDDKPVPFAKLRKQTLKGLLTKADGGRFAPDLWELLQDRSAIAALRSHVIAEFFAEPRQPSRTVRADTPTVTSRLQLRRPSRSRAVRSDTPTAATVSEVAILEDAEGENGQETVEPREACHDSRLGVLLGATDEWAGSLCEQMHHVAWLLHSGYDSQAGAREMVKVWESLDGLMQSASSLESLVAHAEPGQPLLQQLDAQLSQLAREIAAFPSLSSIRRDDVRLSPLLDELLIDDDTLQDVIDVLLARRRDMLDSEAIKLRLEKLRERMVALAKQTIETELQSIFESLSHQWRDPARKLEILGRRYGSDGEGGATLQEVAEHFGVSRERIRQICHPCEADLTKCPVWTPAIDHALHWLEEQGPLLLAEVGPKLREKGIAWSELDLRAVRRIANLFQREMPLEIDVVGEKSFVQSVRANEGDDLAAQILSQARRQVSRWGVATMEDIAVSVSEKRPGGANPNIEGADEAALDSVDHTTPDAVVDAALVERILRTQSDFVVLDEVSGWFWLSSVPRNGLVSQIEKVLAVAPRVRIADLRVGVSRHHRRRGFAPPQRALLELCRQAPGLGVEGDEVFVMTEGAFAWALSPTEQIMADVLRAHGPVMARAELERHCSAAGIPRGTFYTYLQHSPIMERYARSVYGLRGAPVEPGFVESLAPEWTPRRTRVLTDYGWTSDGRAWLGYTLSEGMLNNGVCSVPAAMRRQLQGEYGLWTPDGSYIGRWVCGEIQAWGIKPFFRRRGGEAGDTLLILVDFSSHQATAELGDESLLEEYQGADGS